MVRGEGDEGCGPVGRLAEGRSGSEASGGVADWWLCIRGGKRGAFAERGVHRDGAWREWLLGEGWAFWGEGQGYMLGTRRQPAQGGL